MNKVKVSDKFRFPLELDLGAYLPPELAAESAQYDLTAILIHKGPSASHGHYGAPPRLPACRSLPSHTLNVPMRAQLLGSPSCNADYIMTVCLQ